MKQKLNELQEVMQTRISAHESQKNSKKRTVVNKRDVKSAMKWLRSDKKEYPTGEEKPKKKRPTLVEASATWLRKHKQTNNGKSFEKR